MAIIQGVTAQSAEPGHRETGVFPQLKHLVCLGFLGLLQGILPQPCAGGHGEGGHQGCTCPQQGRVELIPH